MEGSVRNLSPSGGWNGTETTRRRFTREYKARAVQRMIESGRPLADIAAELDVSPGQLSQGRNQQLAAGSAEALAATHRAAAPCRLRRRP